MPSVIEENAWLLALNKPAGLIAHRDGRTIEPSLAEWVLQRYPTLNGVGGAWVSPQGEAIELNGLVHRIDRATSGVVLVAKTPESFAYLKEEFKARRVEKTYLAVVEGTIAAERGEIVAEIMRSRGEKKHWYARPSTNDDRRAAITVWRVLERRSGRTLVELSPRTGRTHQIRVHCASIGHPIVGDHIYGAGGADSRLMLHAHRIRLKLPDGHFASFEAAVPKEFTL